MHFNPIYVVREELDEVTGYSRPCGESPNWELRPKKFYYTAGEDVELSSKVLEPMFYPFTKGLEYISKDKTHLVQKYIYLVRLYNPLYFYLQNTLGLNFLSSNIKEDIRKGKCKLVFTHLYEGYSGIQRTLTKDDFNILQKWVDNDNLPPENVYYINGNLISNQIALNDNCKVNIIPISTMDAWGNILNLPEGTPDFLPVDSKYLYTYYIRKPRTHRVFIAANFIKYNIFDLGKISFNPLQDYKREELLEIDSSIIPYADKLYKIAPIFIDRDNSGIEIVHHMPLSDYTSTFIHLVGETLYTKDTLFISEKTWKPISIGVPFITISNPGSLQWLKDQGFKTFSNWFDESYDSELDPFIRFSKITQLLVDFSKKPINELITIRNQMKDVCTFNKDLLRRRSYDSFCYSEGEYSQDKILVDQLLKIYNT